MTSQDLRQIYDFVCVFCKHFVKERVHGNQKIADSTILFIYMTAFLSENGSYDRAIRRLKKEKLLPVPVAPSTFSKRLKNMGYLIKCLDKSIILQNLLSGKVFAVDSMPLPLMNEVRARIRTRTTRGKFGYCAAKDKKYFGYKLHAVVSIETKNIVEYAFTPANTHDLPALSKLKLDLPPSSVLIGDKAYNSRKVEKCLREEKNITLDPIQKKPKGKEMSYQTEKENRKKGRKRRIIESIFSSLSLRMPTKISYVKESSFLLKISGFILAHNFNVNYPEYFY